jgi:hypothetical protein
MPLTNEIELVCIHLLLRLSIVLRLFHFRTCRVAASDEEPLKGVPFFTVAFAASGLNPFAISLFIRFGSVTYFCVLLNPIKSLPPHTGCQRSPPLSLSSEFFGPCCSEGRKQRESEGTEQQTAFAVVQYRLNID